MLPRLRRMLPDHALQRRQFYGKFAANHRDRLRRHSQHFTEAAIGEIAHIQCNRTGLTAIPIKGNNECFIAGFLTK